MKSDHLRQRRTLLLSGVCLAMFGLSARADNEEGVWAGIQKSGVLKVAFYKDFAPFSNDGKGVDVDIAEALAARMGLKMSPLFFDADESMDDDLRNMVWKGHYMGYGPADLMIHVPIDRDYMVRQDKVEFLAPYHRERYAVAYDKRKLSDLETMAPFEKEPFGVVADTLPDSLMLSADGGRYRAQIRHYKSLDDAAAALRSGEVVGVMALQGELEGAVQGDANFAVVPPPLALLNRRQWPLGVAIRKGEQQLGRAIMAAMNALIAEGEVERIMARGHVVWRAP
ncbi:MAG: transporter substrate-binding domain-containing protein [Gammaproteobacteria bacterium]|jgi:ABC-type amino acid transport substrate-binding protein|nr:transporter substrate-binding domain-containing protein [Gammaproteobacteria bacterium]MBU0772034.1 transporter substrate-binding domain-containing protein [Gammaproteobacteria bacterium]MBU0856417.1 transporter substrate-binding domain-containing protein [Gammaproteobacteria bacterium]MBU1845826.1 transporter substrate-binding domain-containing protein [Gammaproteobacteria bacterium]